MSKIKIVRAPPGQAPDWVRDAWIGVEIPTIKTASRTPGILIGVNGGRPDSRSVGGYEVKLGEAIKVLSMKSPEAAEYWENMFPDQPDRVLVFAKDVCEMV